MNFLAHLFLSGKKEHLVVGNFLADFLKNKAVATLPLLIKEGIQLHRKIDSFTDKHPVVLQSVRRLRPAHRKFSPVVLDICFDYILVKNWGLYTDECIYQFTAGMYEILEDHIHLMPANLKKRLPMMIKDDWLVKYGTEKGLRFTFERMKRRTNYPEYFENAVDSFFKDYGLYEKEFNLFFPDLIEMAKEWRRRNCKGQS